MGWVTVGAMHSGLAALVTRLWGLGVPVVAWLEDRRGIVLVLSGGKTLRVERSDLARPYDRVAEELAEGVPRVELSGLSTSTSLPEIDERTLAWWEFLRWLGPADLEGIGGTT